MRAVVCTPVDGVGRLGVRERRTPEPGPGEVLVAVRLSGVNPIDVKNRHGAGAGDHVEDAHRAVADPSVVGKVVLDLGLPG